MSCEAEYAAWQVAEAYLASLKKLAVTTKSPVVLNQVKAQEKVVAALKTKLTSCQAKHAPKVGLKTRFIGTAIAAALEAGETHGAYCSSAFDIEMRFAADRTVFWLSDIQYTKVTQTKLGDIVSTVTIYSPFPGAVINKSPDPHFPRDLSIHISGGLDIETPPLVNKNKLVHGVSIALRTDGSVTLPPGQSVASSTVQGESLKVTPASNRLQLVGSGVDPDKRTTFFLVLSGNVIDPRPW